MLYMVVERYKNCDAVPVYRRFRERGRMMPDGLRYVSSWVETNWDRCFQLMECDDPAIFAEWIAQWDDLIGFDVAPVVPSSEAVETMRPRL